MCVRRLTRYSAGFTWTQSRFATCTYVATHSLDVGVAVMTCQAHALVMYTATI